MAVQRRSRAHSCAEEILRQGSEIIMIDAEALQAVSHSLEISFVQACEAILYTPGGVLITGLGKSGHVGRKGVFLNENEISRAFVLDPNAAVNTGVPVGFVRIHDYLRLGLA